MMKTEYSTNNKTKTKVIRSLLVISSIVYLIKSDSSFYTHSYLPPGKEQVENSLNIPKVNKYKFSFSQFEISADHASDVPIILNHSHFESFKTFSLICYNNYVSVLLKSAEHFFITDPVIKLLHKSIVRQSSSEDPLFF